MLSLGIGLGAAWLMLWAIAPRPALAAATLTVTNTNDSGSGSLRECISVALPGDTIVFSLTANSTINLLSTLTISTPMTIDGSAAPGLRISGGNAVRVFNVTAPLTLTRLVVANGLSSATNGGGVATSSALTLTSVSFIRNTAPNAGAVFGIGPMTISNTDFLSNTASGRGGGLIVAFNPVVIVGSRFISNTANSDGGAVYLDEGNGSRIENSLFRSNRAGGEGGALWIRNSTVQLATSQFIENGSGAEGAIYLFGGGTGTSVRMDNTIFGGNQSLAGAADVALGGLLPSRLDGRHNTFAADGGVVTALAAGDDIDGDVVVLTNTIFSGYAVGVQTGPFVASITVNGVLWNNVTTPTVGSGITATNVYTGSAAFVNPAARDYHLTGSSAALNRGVASGLTVDLDGDARPATAPDLGADEFVARVYLPLLLK
jgi:hypothetical protein